MKKATTWGAIGAFFGIMLSSVPNHIWIFIYSHLDYIVTWGSGFLALTYTIYQEYREHKRHGSIAIPQVPKLEQTTGDKVE